MTTVKITALILLIFGLCLAALASDCPAAPPSEPNLIDPNSPVGLLLDKINIASHQFKQCQADIEYLFIQDPDLLDSRTLRKGKLYYLQDAGGSWLRLNFDTVKQDDAEEQKKPEHYLFDGVWLTKVDYTLKQVEKIQQNPEGKPVEVFEFISRNFPIVGFSGKDKLQKEFIITLGKADEKQKDVHHLLLKVRPDSIYNKDYTEMEMWIDGKTYLPSRLQSVSTQGDTYDIRISNIQSKKPIDKKLFVIEAPADFSNNVKPLETQN